MTNRTWKFCGVLHWEIFKIYLANAWKVVKRLTYLDWVTLEKITSLNSLNLLNERIVLDIGLKEFSAVMASKQC